MLCLKQKTELGSDPREVSSTAKYPQLHTHQDCWFEERYWQLPKLHTLTAMVKVRLALSFPRMQFNETSPDTLTNMTATILRHHFSSVPASTQAL